MSIEDTADATTATVTTTVKGQPQSSTPNRDDSGNKRLIAKNTSSKLNENSDTSRASDGDSDNLRNNLRRNNTTLDWRARTRLSVSERFNRSKTRHAELDDEEGKAQFFLILLFQSIEDSAGFFASTILFLAAWASICTYGAYELRKLAAADPGGIADQWVDDILNGKNAVTIIGTLFVFTVVFRFNACYDRWWESRIFWGDIISKSLELAMMNRRWFANEEWQDKLSGYIIVFGYSCKSLLRGKSLTEEGEDGKCLVKRGLISQKELDLMHDTPSWQPHFCLDMIREIIVQLHTIPDGKGLRIDDSNKVHGQLFRCLDNTLKDLNTLIGNCVRVRASGLPASYDAITMTSCITFFIIASVVWSMSIGWMTPIIVFLASMIIMFLIVMGSKLVE